MRNMARVPQNNRGYPGNNQLFLCGADISFLEASRTLDRHVNFHIDAAFSL